MIAHNIQVGDRVVHVKSNGRIRGVVESITMTRERKTASVEIDGLNGRRMTYSLENLCPERSWSGERGVEPLDVRVVKP